jgi:DNA-binding protein H-NS
MFMTDTTANLDALPLNDLLNLSELVAAKINQSVEGQKTRIKEDLQMLADTTNRSVYAVFSELFPVIPTVKYRSKHDPNLAWSGRGKQPAWLTSEIAAGAKLEDFLVG